LIVYRGQGLRMRESVTVPTGSFTAQPGDHAALPEGAPGADVDVEVDVAVEDAPTSGDPVVIPAWARFFGLGRIWVGGESANESAAASAEQQLEEGIRREDTEPAHPLPPPSAAAEAATLEVAPASHADVLAVTTQPSLLPVETVASLPQPQAAAGAQDQEAAQPAKQGRAERPSSRPIYWRRRKLVPTVQQRATRSMTTVAEAEAKEQLEAQQAAEPIPEQ